jgi:hypothetical protein
MERFGRTAAAARNGETEDSRGEENPLHRKGAAPKLASEYASEGGRK